MGNSPGNLTKEDYRFARNETPRATSVLHNSRVDGTQQNGLYRDTSFLRHQDSENDGGLADSEMPNAKDVPALEISAETNEKDTMETKQTAEKNGDIKEQDITSMEDTGRALTIKNSRQELQRRDSMAKQKNTGPKKNLIIEKTTKMSLRTKQFQKAGRRDTKTVSVSRKQTAENKTKTVKNKKGQARSDKNNEIDTMASSLKVKDNKLTKDNLVDINHTPTNVSDESFEPDAMHNDIDKYVDENQRAVKSITDHVNPYQELVFSVQQERQRTNRTTSQVRAVDEGKERTAELVNRPYADRKRKSEYREKQKELETSKVEVITAGIAHPRQNIPKNKEAARNVQSETLNARKIKYSRGAQSNPGSAQTSEIIEQTENSSSRRNILSRNAKSETVRQGNLVLPQRKIQSHSAIRAGEKGNGKSKVVKSNDQRTKLFETKGMSTQTHYKAKPVLAVPTKNNTIFKENSVAEESRKIKSDIYPETSVGTNQRDIQSDTAIRGLRAKQPQKVRMAAIREDEIDERHRETSEISITSEKVLIPAEAIVDGDEDYDTNSSLRSTALDSRLFGSQSTIVTHTSGVMFPEPLSRFSENKQRLKENLVTLYTFHNFDPPKSLLLPPSYVQIPKFTHPWMTKLKPLSEDIEMQVADEELLDKKKYLTEQCVNTFHDILNYEMNKKAKNIFLVGEPDSGKTEFLRFMIKTWCEQMKKKQADMKVFDSKEAMNSGLQTHADHDDLNSGDKPHREQEVVPSFSNETIENGDKGIDNCEANLNIKEEDINSTDKGENEDGRKTFADTDILEEFEYLFYVPLCYNKTRENIHEMIKAQYKAVLNNVELDDMVKGSRSRPGENAAFLNELLEKEPEKCLIFLDGLEEWRPHPGHFRHHEKKTLVPGKDPTKCYTIITTCTTQKFNTVRQALKADIDIVINMRGIDEKEHDNLIEETVKQLNSYYGKNKDPEMFMSQLDSPKFRLLIRSPNLLTSMLFLWYQSGAIGDSLCDMASRLLELHMQKLNLTKELNFDNNTVVVKSDEKSVVLPRYFVKLKYCQINADLLYQLGRMAWTSRKGLGKVFDSTGLDIHGVKFSDVQMCLKAGILSQDQFIGFSPIQHNRTVSFPYSVLQDFLAATYLAMLCRDVTYDNSGNVSEHSNRIQAFVVEHLGFMFSSVETILSFSNLFVMLCGLYPPTIKQITNKVYQAVMDDDRIKEYRRYQNCSEEIPMKVQEFILRCAHESTSVVEDDIHVHIGDLIFQTEPVECLKYLVSSDVKTLDIRVADTERSVTTLTALSDFVYQCRIFDRLIKLEIEDRAVCLTIHDIESLFLLIGRCSQTLNVLSIVLYDNHLGTYTRITQNLDKLLPKLVALQVVELRGMKLGHNRYDALVSAFAEMLQLKQVTLADITCQVAKCEGEEHKFDFSDHENLETIAIDGREIRVSGLNKRAVDRCTLGDLAQGVETQILHSLREAPQMKRFVLKLTALRHRPPFVTKKLIDTFNTWSNIATIILTGINFGENEFSVGKNLAMLAHIGLFEVRMSRNVWCHFVDSLSFMLQKVTLSTRGLTVLPTGQDVTRDLVSRPIDAESRAVILARENETALAMDYVRNNDNVFLVILDIEDIFCFETKT